MSCTDKESLIMYRIRCQAFSLCKPPVLSFTGLDSQCIPVPEHFPRRDPVERFAFAFDHVSNCFRDEMERDARGSGMGTMERRAVLGGGGGEYQVPFNFSISSKK